MRICVVDGQGGGFGSVIVRRLRETFEERVEIIGLGTNAVATSAMLKAGANRGATGENAVVRTVARAQVIVGSIGILMANAMMGELTPAMAEAIASSDARKILIPMSQERVEVLGVRGQPLPHFVEELIDALRREVNDSHV
jgi:NAD(P)-dependent dehydrogenase (short-subunit alcohol dehydrogenase family)